MNQTALLQRDNDPTIWSLIAVNLLTILLAVKFHWSLLELMWIYWAQSVTIGVVNVIRLQFDRETASFFALHYGFFHLIYALFLLIFTLAGGEIFPGASSINWWSVLGVSLLFIVNHGFSFIYNREKDAAKADADRLMFFPYARIIPMHLTIILGAVAGEFFTAPWLVANFPILLFLGLKTAADVIMHLIEHR
jgi:hypothetical protein